MTATFWQVTKYSLPEHGEVRCVKAHVSNHQMSQGANLEPMDKPYMQMLAASSYNNAFL